MNARTPMRLVDGEDPEKPLDLSVEKVKQLTHAYLNTCQSVADMGVDLGIPTPVVRAALKQFGLIEAKKAAIAEAQQAEQAAYVDFLVKNRVPTAKKHLEISDKLVGIVGQLADKVGSPDEEGFMQACEDLKKSIGTLRTLAEVLEKSSGVGARSVSLGGVSAGGPTAMQQMEAAAGGRRPLITFNVGAAAPPRQGILSAEVIEVEDS